MATNGNIASLKSQENLQYFTILWKTKKNDNKTFRKPKGKLVILNLWSIKFSKCHVGALLLYLTDMRKFIRYCSGGTTLPRKLTVVFDEGGVIFSSTCMLQFHLPRAVESYEIFQPGNWNCYQWPCRCS